MREILQICFCAKGKLISRVHQLSKMVATWTLWPHFFNCSSHLKLFCHIISNIIFSNTFLSDLFLMLSVKVLKNFIGNFNQRHFLSQPQWQRNATQPQHCSWIGHKNYFAHHPPPHKLNNSLHEPQIIIYRAQLYIMLFEANFGGKVVSCAWHLIKIIPL